MILFEGGKELYRYEGKKTADDFVSWLQNPTAPPPPPPPEKAWFVLAINALMSGAEVGGGGAQRAAPGRGELWCGG